MNPDIDSDRSRTYKNWLFVRGYWYYYTKKMPHKGDSGFPLEVRRGIGHNLFIGTGIRLIYASPLFILTNGMVKLQFNNWLIVIAGIWFSDALHIIVDFLFHRNFKNAKPTTKK
jgi:uncharacterized metal-binding protein